jgi:hypothetical protein
MKELFTALVAAQAEMEAASKDSNNPFFKSKYADLNAVMGVVKAAYAKHGLGFVQVCHDAEHAAKVETLIVHASGQQMACGSVSVPVSKLDAQGYGSALTYARRYSLAAACGVGAEDDDGNAAAKAKPVPISAKPVAKATFDDLPEEEQKFLREQAEIVCKELVMTGPAEAKAILDGLNLDPEEKVAIWSLFDSKQREALNPKRKAA